MTPIRRLAATLSLTVGTCLGLACRDGLAPVSADTTEVFVATLIDGAGQTTSAGELLPTVVRVRVTTESGRPVRDAALLAAGSGCGTFVTCATPPDTAAFPRIDGDSVRTGADGTATFRLRAPRRIAPTSASDGGDAPIELSVNVFGRSPTGSNALRGTVRVPTVVRPGPVASLTWPLPVPFALDSGVPSVSYVSAVDAYGNAIDPARLPPLGVRLTDTTVATARVYRGARGG